MAETPHELIYEEALRAIKQQQDVLSGLQARTGTLLAVASLSASFLGGQALKDGDLSCWSWAAIVMLGLVVATTIAILWPRWGWKFTSYIDMLKRDFVDAGYRVPMTRMYLKLAESMDDDRNDNEDKLTLLQRLFQLGCGLLFAEIALWLIDLGTR